MRLLRSFSTLLATALALLGLPVGGSAQADVDMGQVQPVSREALRRAMIIERDKGYDLTASTNGGRFWAATLLQLAEWAYEDAPDGPPLFVHEADYFYAYVAVTGLAEDEVPDFVRMAHEYGQHTLIEYRLDHVVDLSRTGTRPVRALAVRTWWPESAGLGEKYSYEDTLSTPALLVENEREVSYRLLDFGGQIVYDEIVGIRGRPTSGVLGALFKVIGTGRLVWTRMAVSEDGLLLVRARAKKVVSKTAMAVVDPNGIGTKLPDDRGDLLALAETLEQPLDVAYRPWPF